MLKMGDFAKLARVSVKTLRHYGKLGLLKPAWVDRFTGYRYYALEQLPRLLPLLPPLLWQASVQSTLATTTGGCCAPPRAAGRRDWPGCPAGLYRLPAR